jgi:hypothetical protein
MCSIFIEDVIKFKQNCVTILWEVKTKRDSYIYSQSIYNKRFETAYFPLTKGRVILMSLGILHMSIDFFCKTAEPNGWDYLDYINGIQDLGSKCKHLL